MLSPALLTPEDSVVLLLDYQHHVLADMHSHNHEYIELQAKALARATQVFDVPVILSTIGVQLRGDQPTVPSIREEIPDVPELDRTTMNAWDDGAFVSAVAKTGRRRLIFAAVWTEVCLLYPVLHAQREGFETYFVADAVGGSTRLAHDTAVQRMIQAGSQPVTLNSLLTEWIRDWATTPYGDGIMSYFNWYGPEIQKLQERLGASPELVAA